jgi:hypothetical protein
MCKINKYISTQFYTKHQPVYQKHCHGFRFPLNFKPITFKISQSKQWNFLLKMIQIILYMHILTPDEEQHSTIRNVKRKFFVYTYSVCFCEFVYWLLKCATIFVIYTLYFLCLHQAVPFQEQKNIKIIIETKVLVRYMSLCFIVCTWFLLRRQIWKNQSS